MDGQGTEQVEIQWNDHTGNATVKVVSPLQPTGGRDVHRHRQPAAQSGHQPDGDLCPGAFNQAELHHRCPSTMFGKAPTASQDSMPNSSSFNAGEHEVTVTDGLGCHGTAYFTVEAAPVLWPTSRPRTPTSSVSRPSSTCRHVHADRLGWSHLWNTGSTASNQSHIDPESVGAARPPIRSPPPLMPRDVRPSTSTWSRRATANAPATATAPLSRRIRRHRGLRCRHGR